MSHNAPVSSRKEQAQQSRARIVDSALALFVRQGYKATSVSEILEATGLARGALYHHFPEGKKAVFLAVVDVVDEAFHHGIEDILGTIDSPVEQISAGFELLLRLAADPTFARIILIEAATVVPGAWAEGSEYLLLRAAIEQAITAGEIRAVPLDAAASTLYGAARRAADLVARSDHPARVAAECQEVLDLLLGGMRT
jgi:AcrR family transcriptional regulator